MFESRANPGKYQVGEANRKGFSSRGCGSGMDSDDLCSKVLQQFIFVVCIMD